MAWNDDATHRAPINVASAYVAGDVADYPMLVTAAMLPSDMLDADGTAPAINGGGDIRFSSDEAGTSRLACEIVSFVTDNNPASATAEIYVLVPNLYASSGGTIYVWWGETSGVQPAVDALYGRDAVWVDYDIVMHLADASDSTGNTTPAISGATAVSSGLIGSSYSFAGSGNRIDATFTPWSGYVFTMQAIGTRGVLSGTAETLVSIADKDSTSQQYRVITNSSAVDFSKFDGTLSAAEGSIAGLGPYAISAVSEAQTSRKIDVNGGTVTATDTTSASITGIDRFTVGVTADSTPLGFLGGTVDEARLRRSVLSEAWIETEYNNQSSPALFASSGTVTELGGALTPPTLGTVTGVSLTPTTARITVPVSFA